MANDNNDPVATQETPMETPTVSNQSLGAARGHPKGVGKSTQGKYGTYSADEFSTAAHEQFRTSPDIVMAAFKTAGKDRATLDEAKQIVKGFMERTVK